LFQGGKGRRKERDTKNLKWGKHALLVFVEPKRKEMHDEKNGTHWEKGEKKKACSCENADNFEGPEKKEKSR